MMIFQGRPFEDEKFEQTIDELWEVMKSYNPEIYGFKWQMRMDPGSNSHRWDTGDIWRQGL
jgi:hypothetical protein